MDIALVASMNKRAATAKPLLTMLQPAAAGRFQLLA